MSVMSIAVDGASRGNPGAAGIGVVVYDESGNVLSEISEYIGKTTNNVAEYSALIRGLEEALRLGATSVRIQTDSELLARQITGVYRVKAKHLLPHYQQALALLARFQDAKIRGVPREENARADQLASEAAKRGPVANNNKWDSIPKARTEEVAASPEAQLGFGIIVERLKPMKVVAFNGSARRDGNTAILINRVFAELESEGIETELFQFAGAKIHGCRACRACWSAQNGRCAYDDDVANECIDKMKAADGIILASPTYFADISTETKAIIDRAGMVSLANGTLLRRKVGAAIVAVRRGGAIHAFDSMNHFFLVNQMVVPGSSYWNVGIGHEVGMVESDEEGIRTMVNLGQNMTWLLKRLHD